MGYVEFLAEVMVAVGSLTAPLILAVRLLDGGETGGSPDPVLLEEEPPRWNVGAVDGRVGRQRAAPAQYGTRSHPITLRP